MSDIQVEVTGANGATVTVGGSSGNDIDITQGGVVDVSAGSVSTGSIASLALVAGTGISITTANGGHVISATGTSLDDFVTGTPATDQTIKWDGTNWVPTDFDTGTEITSLDDVPGVDLTTNAPAAGQILSWDGTNWVPANDATSSGGTGATTLAELTDVSSAVAANGHSLIWTGTLWESKDALANENGAVTVTSGSGELVVKGGVSESGSVTLNCESNTHGVKIQGPPHAAGATYTLTLPHTTGTSGQVLSTDGTGNLNWVNRSTGGTGSDVSVLNDLDNVSGNPADGQVLTYAGAGWVPRTPSGGGGFSWSTAPANSTDSGSAGDLAYDNNFLYLHNGTQWVRAAMSSFGAAVNPVITVTENPQSETAQAGSDVEFTATATVDNAATPTVQWQLSADGGQTWSDVSGETSTTITLSSVPQTANGDQYRAVFSSTDADDAISSVSTLSVVTSTVDLSIDGGWWTPLGWNNNAPSGAFLGLSTGSRRFTASTTIWPTANSQVAAVQSAPSNFNFGLPTNTSQSLSTTWANSNQTDCYIRLLAQLPPSANSSITNWSYDLTFNAQVTKGGVTQQVEITGSGSNPSATNILSHTGGSGNNAIRLTFGGGSSTHNMEIDAPNVAYNMIQYGSLNIDYFAGVLDFYPNWNAPSVPLAGGVTSYTIESRSKNTSTSPGAPWSSWTTLATISNTTAGVVNTTYDEDTTGFNHEDTYGFRIRANYASSSSAWVYDGDYVCNLAIYKSSAVNLQSRGSYCSGW